jgi:hypothetical protein
MPQPATKNILEEMYTALFDLLEANDEWAGLVPEGNRVRFDTVTGDENPIPDNKPQSDADMDSAVLEMTEGDSGLFTNDETFATYSQEGPPQFLEKGSVTFTLHLKSRFLSEQEGSQLVSYSVNAVRMGGPKLGGLPYVTSVKPKFTSKREAVPETDNMTRIVSDVTFTIEYEADGRTLTGEEQ